MRTREEKNKAEAQSRLQAKILGIGILERTIANYDYYMSQPPPPPPPPALRIPTDVERIKMKLARELIAFSLS